MIGELRYQFQLTRKKISGKLMISRDTKWRQGSIITNESFETLCPSDNKQTICAVIISHDCDLPNEHEDCVEIIVGDLIENADTNFTHARHVRRLHLKYQIKDSPKFFIIELTHAKRKSIPKKDFSEKAVRNENFILPDEEKKALRLWLSARYGRPAFPNAFDSRLKNHKKLEKN